MSNFKSVKALSRLPAGYVEVEYLQSFGDEYIDTLFKCNNNTRFKTKVIPTVQPARFSWIAGGRTTGGAGAGFGVGSNDAKKLISEYGGNRAVFDLPITQNKVYEIDKNKNVCNIIVDGNTYTETQPTATFSENRTLYLFALDNTGTTSDKSSYKMYYFEIYDNGTLVHNFIPCKYNNEYGMYDLVSKQFFGNQGSGAFTGGDEVNGGIKTFKSVKSFSRLPSGYTELEYIESTGTQYIDLGVKGNQNTRIDIEYEYLSGSPSSRIFGNRVNNRNKELFLGTLAGSVPDKLFFGYRNGGLSSATGYDNININIDLNTRVRITINDDYSLTVNGTKYNLTSLSSNTFTTSTNLDLFRGSIDGGSTYKGASIKIYMFKLWDSNTLVRDFIPIKVGTEYAMYDKITHQVFRNSGTGSFTGGQEVSSGIKKFVSARDDLIPTIYERVSYIESTGTQYIDSGYLTGNNVSMEIDATSLSNTSQYHAMGYFESSGNNCYALFGSNAGVIQCAVNNNASIHTAPFNWKNSRHKVKLDVGTLYVDDVDYGTIIPNLTTYHNIYVGALNGNTTYHAEKIYSAKIWNNGVLVRNFIPVKKKSNNEYGMYDTVTKQFYGNSGTGSFTGGN